ncbi:chemotaxis protein CheX [Tindallia californiensis]|uniref:Chemotaxis protein CheX n=1 Tax=Tindallia californiensis TaxID=159292 RepID=A0A1H3I639_9FIRM|nr:chemotaxis protein CheX [Tindallia californiensis]SDY22578.1 chemotaxis protein CheX [Tindallia californiensis]
MDNRLLDPFLKSTKDMLLQMASVSLKEHDDFKEQATDIKSYGVTTLVTFVGKVKGRLLIDMEVNVASKIVKEVLGETLQDPKDSTYMGMVSELNNIIGGDAITYLNNEMALGLRLASPAVFTGKDVIISIPKIQSSTVECMTEQGKLRINVAFERGGEA